MTPLAIIPARAGSKGLPGKNKREFSGRPLVSWAIDAGRETCAGVCVTTDDAEVMRLARPLAFVIDRNPALAGDDVPMVAVVADAVGAYRAHVEPDTIVLLQPTAPLRRPEHIRAALALLERTGADSVVSVVEIPAHYSPDYSCHIDEDGDLRPNVLNCEYGASFEGGPTRRQDCEKAYSRDGTVYVTRRATIEAGSLYGRRCVPLIIPPHESANIDTEEDWQRAEEIMRKRLA